MQKGLVFLAVATALIGTGCDMYFGGDDTDPCKDYGYGYDQPAPQQLRDPSTGVCESWGTNPYPCDGTCGPCAESGGADGGAVIANPDWGSCYSQCEALDENSCLTTSGCYAAYQDNSTIDEPPSFWGCWQTAPSGPISTGTCTNLDAQTCSEHDNCTAHYDGYYGATKFISCEAEPTTTAVCNEACAAGYHCEDHCYDSTPNMMQTCEALCVQDLTCASVDCGPGYTCSEVCGPDANGNTTCHPSCVVDNAACETLQTESECTARGDCEPVYDGQDCTCYPYGCTCQILTYESCETVGKL